MLFADDPDEGIGGASRSSGSGSLPHHATSPPASEDPPQPPAAEPISPELAAEILEWQQKVQVLKEQSERSDRSRTELRGAVEAQQWKVASLTSEKDKLAQGGAAEEIAAEKSNVEVQLGLVEEEFQAARTGLKEQEALLAAAEAKALEAAQRAVELRLRFEREEREKRELEEAAKQMQDEAEAAEARLHGMVEAAAVQQHEVVARERREALRTVDRESRQLRVALAEALSSGADLPTALEELEVLRQSAEAARQRIQALEELNAQLEERLVQLDSEIAGLRKGTLDLKGEEDLMREVIIQQSEKLLRKVEDLTDERRTADADRQQLLTWAAGLQAKVEAGEARIARRDELQAHCATLEASRVTVAAEVERLRRTNDALCQQVLHDESEGLLAGVLSSETVLSGEDGAIRDEINRLVRGQLLISTQAGSVKADAMELALKLQQLLAEREEAFWVERQQLSDRVAALERARGGRTGSLLRQYDATARGAAAASICSSGGATVAGLAQAPAAAAAAVAGRLRQLGSLLA